MKADAYSCRVASCFCFMLALLLYLPLARASLGSTRAGWGAQQRCGGVTHGAWTLRGDDAVVVTVDTTHCAFRTPAAYATALSSGGDGGGNTGETHFGGSEGAVSHALAAADMGGFEVCLSVHMFTQMCHANCLAHRPPTTRPQQVLVQHVALRGLALLRASRIYGWRVQWLGEAGPHTGATILGRTGWRDAQVHIDGKAKERRAATDEGLAGRSSYALAVSVSTVLCGFKTAPLYFTSLVRPRISGHTLRTYGVHTVYRPTAASFHAYMVLEGAGAGATGGAAARVAEQAGWHVTWIGVAARDDGQSEFAAQLQGYSAASWRLDGGGELYTAVDSPPPACAHPKGVATIISLESGFTDYAISLSIRYGGSGISQGFRVYLLPLAGTARTVARLAAFYQWKVAYACVPRTPVPPAVAARAAAEKAVLRFGASVAVPRGGTLTALRFQQHFQQRFFHALRRLALDSALFTPRLVDIRNEHRHGFDGRVAITLNATAGFADAALREAAAFALADPQLGRKLAARALLPGGTTVTIFVEPGGVPPSALAALERQSVNAQRRRQQQQPQPGGGIGGHRAKQHSDDPVAVLLAALAAAVVGLSAYLLFSGSGPVTCSAAGVTPTVPPARSPREHSYQQCGAAAAAAAAVAPAHALVEDEYSDDI